ncbi:MAG: response regulator [Deltaproteobacteria bacterium]|nr:response regulator [Deltaproteobacteria bacterium]
MARILVVDDDEHNLFVTGEILSHQGHEVDRAANGAEALAMALREKPDLVVTDVLMPVMDGFTLCREWMRHEELCHIPFLFYTATYTDANDRALGLGLGARHFLIKSPDSSRLVEAVRKALEEKKPARRRTEPAPAMDSENILQEYNAVLIRKLESKMVQLLEANKALEEEINKRRQAELDARRALEKLHQADKMSTIGQLAAGIAHEINNPVAFVLPNLHQIRAEVDLLAEYFNLVEPEDGMDRPSVFCREKKLRERCADLPQVLDDCLAGMERIRDISKDLRHFSRLDGELYESVRMEDLLESSLHIAMNLIKYRAEVERDYESIPELVVNKGKMGQVLLNILVNAAQAIDDEDSVNHRIRVSTRCIGDEIRVEIANTGEAIPPDIQSRIFDPFFTTKAPDEGTGLGLSISASIIQQHGGRIELESNSDLTRFTLCLPIKNGLTA